MLPPAVQRSNPNPGPQPSIAFALALTQHQPCRSIVFKPRPFTSSPLAPQPFHSSHRLRSSSSGRPSEGGAARKASAAAPVQLPRSSSSASRAASAEAASPGEPDADELERGSAGWPSCGVAAAPLRRTGSRVSTGSDAFERRRGAVSAAVPAAEGEVPPERPSQQLLTAQEQVRRLQARLEASAAACDAWQAASERAAAEAASLREQLQQSSDAWVAERESLAGAAAAAAAAHAAALAANVTAARRAEAGAKSSEISRSKADARVAALTRENAVRRVRG